jgi:hypothetical protein
MPWNTSPTDDLLVSVSDFTNWFSLSLDSTGQARGETALAIASAAIRNGRRNFDYVVDETLRLDGTGRASFQTPKNRLPIVDVSEIQEQRDWDTTFNVVDAASYDWDEYGIVTLNGSVHPCWTSRRRCIQITYSHGYATIPGDVAGVCLALAKRLYDDPAQQNIAVEQLGDAHFEYDGGTFLLPDEVRILSTYAVPV